MCLGYEEADSEKMMGEMLEYSHGKLWLAFGSNKNYRYSRGYLTCSGGWSNKKTIIKRMNY